MVELELEDDNEEVLDKELKLEDEEINEKLILEYEEEPELEDKEDVVELEDEEDMVEPENLKMKEGWRKNWNLMMK